MLLYGLIKWFETTYLGNVYRKNEHQIYSSPFPISFTPPNLFTFHCLTVCTKSHIKVSQVQVQQTYIKIQLLRLLFDLCSSVSLILRRILFYITIIVG